jgi:uncharacterized linocin/CFP29 family protein
MTDFLMRENAPLTEGEWEKLDALVIDTAKKRMAARRFVPFYGPVGAGTQIVPLDRLGGVKAAEVGSGAELGEPVVLQERDYLPLAYIFKDFMLRWSDIALSRQDGGALDLSPAAAASAMVAQAEDALVFQGLGRTAGLLKLKGRTTSPIGEWASTNGAGLDAVLAGWRKLTDAGFVGPFALVVSANLYAKLHRVNGGTGVLEISQVRELVNQVYTAPALKENQALLVAASPANLDLAVGQDLITGYIANDGMDHVFRVFETLVLRVRQPAAICTFE